VVKQHLRTSATLTIPQTRSPELDHAGRRLRTHVELLTSFPSAPAKRTVRHVTAAQASEPDILSTAPCCTWAPVTVRGSTGTKHILLAALHQAHTRLSQHSLQRPAAPNALCRASQHGGGQPLVEAGVCWRSGLGQILPQPAGCEQHPSPGQLRAAAGGPLAQAIAAGQPVLGRQVDDEQPLEGVLQDHQHVHDLRAADDASHHSCKC